MRAIGAAAKLKLRLRSCEICEESVLLEDGVTCAGVNGQADTQHYTCDDGFGQHVAVEAEKCITDLVERNGNIFCPMVKSACNCTTPFSEQVIIQHCTKQQFQMFFCSKNTY